MGMRFNTGDTVYLRDEAMSGTLLPIKVDGISIDSREYLQINQIGYVSGRVPEENACSREEALRMVIAFYQAIQKKDRGPVPRFKRGEMAYFVKDALAGNYKKFLIDLEHRVRRLWNLLFQLDEYSFERE